MEVALSQPLPLPDPPLTFGAGDQRWLLRRWTPADASALLAAWHDDTIAAFNRVPPEPSVEQARDWISGAERRRRAGSAVDLVIALDADPDSPAVGEVGLADHRPDRRAAQISWWLLPPARGSGVATAAVNTLSTWALGKGGLVLLVARCAPGNEPAFRLAERAGYDHAQTDRTGHRIYVRRR